MVISPKSIYRLIFNVTPKFNCLSVSGGVATSPVFVASGETSKN